MPIDQGFDRHRLKCEGAWNFAIGYLRVLRSAACSAAEPTAAARDVIYETAQVCAMVASHARYLPCDQRTSMAPFGRFPSALKRPSGSFVLGIPAFVRARHKMSLLLMNGLDFCGWMNGWKSFGWIARLYGWAFLG